jgi:hypothetical protein
MTPGGFVYLAEIEVLMGYSLRAVGLTAPGARESLRAGFDHVARYSEEAGHPLERPSFDEWLDDVSITQFRVGVALWGDSPAARVS